MTTNKTTPAISANIHGERLILTFSNGNELAIDATQLSTEMRIAAMMHGLKQKLVDAAAISRDPTTGRTAGIDIKAAAVREVAERLLAGEWNKRREGGGNAGGLLFRALCEMYAGRKTTDDITKYLATLSDKEKAALRKNPRVAEVIERLRAASGDDNSDELLAGLEEGV